MLQERNILKRSSSRLRVARRNSLLKRSLPKNSGTNIRIVLTCTACKALMFIFKAPGTTPTHTKTIPFGNRRFSGVKTVSERKPILNVLIRQTLTSGSLTRPFR